MNNPNNSPNPTPSVIAVVAGVLKQYASAFYIDYAQGTSDEAAEKLALYVAEALAKSAAPQHTGLTDVERRQRVIDALWALRTDHLPSMEEIADAAIAAMQQPVCADVKRLLREARSYVEQAGLRHHDVSGLLAEIDAVLAILQGDGK